MKKCKAKNLENSEFCHCRLLTNDSKYIDSILERKCIEFLFGIFNSENQIYTSMIKYSLTNCDSTKGENIRCLLLIKKL